LDIQDAGQKCVDIAGRKKVKERDLLKYQEVDMKMAYPGGRSV
jgi:hypothetical protein